MHTSPTNPILSSPFRELHLYPGPPPRRALDTDFRPVEECAVFYDGQPQSGTSPLFGMALIHSVKALKYTLMMLLWYPDSGIR